MVICLKKTRVIYFVMVAFIAMIGFMDSVFADDEDYSYYESKAIKKTCIYAKDKHINVASNSKEYAYLYIYDDDTAAIGWSSTGCARTNSKGMCADGYIKDGTEYSGLLNWSKNNTEERVSSVSDAYEYYSSTGSCPGYIAKSANWQENRFLLAPGSDASALSEIESANESILGSTKSSYYNQDTSDFTMDSDLVCKYKVSKSVDRDISEEQTINFNKDGSITTNGSTVISDKMLSSMYTSLLEDNKCPKALDSCVSEQSTPLGGGTQKYLIVYGDISVATESCDTNNFLTLECTGDNCSSISVCQLYSDYEKKLRDDISGYVSQDFSSRKKMLNEYNKHKSQLNSYCNSVLKTLDYVEGNCMEKCINLMSELSNLEEENGLRNPYSEQKCNIGEQVVAMVYNVLKWGKYIAPVLVIILTILDFIKALAAQSDDDMKKAQGKFIRRLIVAALLFLLPLIINFALKTFGFYSSSCDITDLF